MVRSVEVGVLGIEVGNPSFSRGSPMPEPWVSPQEVASHRGVAKESVFRRIGGKGLPAHRAGRLWKCWLSEVDPWGAASGAGQDVPNGPAPGRRRKG